MLVLEPPRPPSWFTAMSRGSVRSPSGGRWRVHGCGSPEAKRSIRPRRVTRTFMSRSTTTQGVAYVEVYDKETARRWWGSGAGPRVVLDQFHTRRCGPRRHATHRSRVPRYVRAVGLGGTGMGPVGVQIAEGSVESESGVVAARSGPAVQRAVRAEEVGARSGGDHRGRILMAFPEGELAIEDEALLVVGMAVPSVVAVIPLVGTAEPHVPCRVLPRGFMSLSGICGTGTQRRSKARPGVRSAGLPMNDVSNRTGPTS